MRINVTKPSMLFLAVVALSCGPPTPATGKPTGATCPSSQTLTYANFGKSFVQTYCLRCHSATVAGAARNGAPDDHNFDALEDVKPLAEHIDELAGAGPAGTNTLMPNGDPLPSVQERRNLSEWLACGAPP